MKKAFQIAIPRRANCCLQCQRVMQEGTEYYSLITPGNLEDHYIRQDYCLSCWAEQVNKAKGGYWKATVPFRKEPSELPKQRDARALHLLKENILCNHLEDYSETFVLSLYLARRRRITFRRDMLLPDGKQGALYEVADTEEMLLVPKVLLSDLQVENLQLTLAKKFQTNDSDP